MKFRIFWCNENYNYTPASFINGDLQNTATENQGSAKLFCFGVIHQLTKLEVLHCFGEHYQGVLNDPEGDSHQNSKAMAVFYKLVKLVKNGVLMSIHIYAKVSYNKIFFKYIFMLKPKQLFIIIYVNVYVKRVYPHKTNNTMIEFAMITCLSKTNH
jgi:hypothetical protein